MKANWIIAAGLFVQVNVSAQKTGTITYLEKMKMDFELDSATRAMLHDLPSETSVQKLLLFTEDASLYTDAPKEENDRRVEESEGRRIEIRMDGPNEKTYTDFKNNRLITQRDFMGKLFLIDTALTKTDWKLTGKQKSLLAYPCQQAMKVSGQDTVYAWFTPAIQVSTGPAGLHGLPGLILEVNMNRGRVNITAQKVDLQQPDVSVMVKPKEGKKVKPYEFRKIMDEKTKEMQETHEGNGNMIIKIERR